MKKNATSQWPTIIAKADEQRKVFVAAHYKGKVSMSKGSLRVTRKTIYDDAIIHYLTKPMTANVVPISVVFDGEEGVDLGGVCRDFLGGFWEEAYVKMFDGSAQLTPILHVDIDMSHYDVLGQIMSHGYLCCGFLPTRVSFPVIASVLLGCSVNIPQEILLHSFLEFLSQVDRKLVVSALVATEFKEGMKVGIINILSRFGCREIPTPENLSRVLCILAQHHFISRPFAAISSINSGVPDKHKEFWETIEVSNFCDLYEALGASPEKVLEQIVEPYFESTNEERVFGYYSSTLAK